MITRRLSTNPNSAPQILQNWGLPVLPKSPISSTMAPRELNILYQGNKLIKFWIYSRWSPITIDIVKQVWLKWLVSARFLFHVVKYSNGDQIFPVDVCTIWLYGLLAIVATFAHNELYQTLTMNSLSVLSIIVAAFAIMAALDHNGLCQPLALSELSVDFRLLWLPWPQRTELHITSRS